MNTHKLSFAFLLIILNFSWADITSSQIAKQKYREIFSSDDYYSERVVFDGVPTGEELKNLKAEAKKGLAFNIKSEVITSSEQNTQENSQEFKQEFSSNIQAESSLRLENVKFISSQDGGMFWVCAYVHKLSLVESSEKIAQEVKELLTQYYGFEQKNEEVFALKYLNQVIQKAKFSSKPISYKNEDGFEIADVGIYAKAKIEEIMAGFILEANSARLNPDELGEYLVPIQVKNSTRKVRGVDLYLKDDKASNMSIDGGSVDFKLAFAPSQVRSIVKVVLVPSWDKTGEYRVTKNLELDFRKLITVDFRIEEKGNKLYKFIPVIKNLNVQKVEWDFGGQGASEQLESLFQFSKTAGVQVSMQVNGNLKKAKFLEGVPSNTNVIPQKKEPILVKNKLEVQESKIAFPKDLIDLSQKETLKEALGVLKGLKRKGVVRFKKASKGWQKELGLKTGSYSGFNILVYDSKLKVIGFISKSSNGNRLELKSSSLSGDFLNKLKGQKIGGVWVEWLD